MEKCVKGVIHCYNLKQKGGFRLWNNYTKNSRTSRSRNFYNAMSKKKSKESIFNKFSALKKDASGIYLKNILIIPRILLFGIREQVKLVQ